MYWESVLKEVLNKGSNKQAFSFTNLGAKKENKNYLRSKNRTLRPRVLKAYSLGGKHGNLYFTKREAECMSRMLRGKTITRVADELELSPRTVEFYLKNMKSKLGCRTKFELIEVVLDSDFLKNVDF